LYYKHLYWIGLFIQNCVYNARLNVISPCFMKFVEERIFKGYWFYLFWQTVFKLNISDRNRLRYEVSAGFIEISR